MLDLHQAFKLGAQITFAKSRLTTIHVNLAEHMAHVLTCALLFGILVQLNK